MKRLNLFPILFTLILLLLVSNLAAALIDAEAAKIPYQVNNSDRIVIGTVSKIDTYSSYTIYTVKVKEWLYNPIPAETIKIRSKIGTNLTVEDEVEFAQNESALLMLNDGNLDELLFRVPLGIKYPVSDRDAVIEELKAQGKWQEENQTENKTSETGMKENTGTTGEQEESSNQTQKSNTTPFMSPVCMLAVIGVIIYVRRKN
ncbi:hypothetical protein [Methanosarcina barkeri]|uniref:Uncharacterized protein n=1 Tax=Methanosarcina barkeri 227 TaxID=1434106 RepID=A0A0E3LR86_METBA|nr:hypothetical protein [Methanosarcina barkeri]AKB59586.1 hypothetical protein MSBR2_3070 [Methanosarcina barkeri 227]